MKPQEFFELVSKMRDLQKQYFATRDRQILQQSKQVERQIDEEICRVRIILANKSSNS